MPKMSLAKTPLNWSRAAVYIIIALTDPKAKPKQAEAIPMAFNLANINEGRLKVGNAVAPIHLFAKEDFPASGGQILIASRWILSEEILHMLRRSPVHATGWR